MELKELIGHLGEASVADVEVVFQDFLRGEARRVFLSVLAQEVELLCGPAYRPRSEAECRRAGSAKGFFYDGTLRKEITRPRIRRRHADGTEAEAALKTYEVGQQSGALQRMLIATLRAGVSSRDQGALHENARGTSSSTVSRLWARDSARAFEEFRERNIVRPDWLVLMLDGIVLGGDLVAIVALGICATGEKMLLDFELGASENQAVAESLLVRLNARGFTPATRRLYAVTDGAKALKNAIQKHFGDVVIQRCVVHKERNLRGYLSRKHHGELAHLFKRLRQAQGAEAGEEALKAIKAFLATKNKQAQECLEEAGDELIALHRLRVPATLHTSLLSTNCIENPIRNTRAKTRRVTRWRGETTQPSRWLAYALLEAEKGFHRIRGHGDLNALREALDRRSITQEATTEKVAGPITSEERVDGMNGKT